MDVGIDDFAIHFPRLYFDMKDFAKFRGADFEKLNKITSLNVPNLILGPHGPDPEET